MALTLNNFTGFETQGFEEASSTSGSPTFETTNQRTGASALKLGLDRFDMSWVGAGITDAGTDYIVGFAFRKNTDPGGSKTIFQVNDDTGGMIVRIILDSDGKLNLMNADISVIDTSAIVLNDDQWYYIEIYAQLNNGSGAWEWFIDKISEGSGSSDFTNGNAFGSASSIVRFVASSDFTGLFDDVYILSGAASAADRLGDFAVKAYQNTAEDATDQGDTLAGGTWANVGETPGNESNEANYADTGNLAGSTICDEGTRAGPSGDSDLTGATIKGAKWIGKFKRGTGGGRTHEFWVGNDADWITTPTTKTVIDLTLATDYGIFEHLLAASDLSVPTTSDFFQHGFSKSATAGQDIFCAEIWAMLGYVPAALAVDTTILVPQEVLTQTDNDPELRTGVTILTPQEVLTQTDNDPALNTGVNVEVPQDILIQTDNAPTFPTIIVTPQDSLTQTDQVPDIRTGVTVEAPTDTQIQTDNVPGVSTGVNVEIPQEAFVQVDNAPTIPQIIGVPVDNLSQVDSPPDIRTGVAVDVPQDSLNETDNLPIVQTSIAVPQDNLVQTDQVPIINTGLRVDVPTETLTETDNSPVINIGVDVFAPQDVLTQVDSIPNLFTGVTVEPPADALIETDNIPDLFTGVTVITPTEILIQVDNPPTIGAGIQINVPQDVLTQVDNAPEANTGVEVKPPQDSLIQIDSVPNINTGVNIETPQEVLTQTDNIPSVDINVQINVSVDTLSIADQTPNINVGVNIETPQDILTLVDNIPIIITAAAVAGSSYKPVFRPRRRR